MQRRLAVNVHGQMPWSAGSWAGEWTLDAHVWWPRGNASDACVAIAVGQLLGGAWAGSQSGLQEEQED